MEIPADEWICALPKLNADEGYDIVSSTVNYTLAANVEALVLTGTSNLTGTGSSLDNEILGNSGNNTLTGGAGNDTLDGGTGSDALTGGTGDDLYYVDNAADVVSESATEGYDIVSSTVNYTLTANVEALVLTGTSNLTGTGNSLDNEIYGNSGNNTLTGGAGDDTLVGGLGDDVYYFDNAGDAIVENANEGIDTVISTVNDLTLEGVAVENLTLAGTVISGYGNELDNVITGNSQANSLSGGAGNDTLDGGAGNDTLVGGDGDDVLIGGLGDDTMAGGAGNDTYYVPVGSDIIAESVNEGIDTIVAYVSLDLSVAGFENFENVTIDDTAGSGTYAIGNDSDNILTGNSGNNTLAGGAGNDTLDGGTGIFSDYLYGGTGDDVYILESGLNSDFVYENAAEGIDTVVANYTYSLGSDVENLTLTGTSAINATGNSLDNILEGNSAANSLSGAAGNDTYVTGVGGGTDTITDSSGTGDIVSFDSSVAKAAVAFFMNGNDLEIGYVGSSDLATIHNQAVSGQSVEQFMLSDGDYLSDSDINTIIQQMSTYATDHSVAFTSLSDVKANSDLMNIISSSWNVA